MILNRKNQEKIVKDKLIAAFKQDVKEENKP